MADTDFSTPDPAQFGDELIGPFFDANGVQNLTGLSPTEIISYGIAGDILAVRTSDDVTLFPTFQFGARGDLLPGLRGVAEALRAADIRGWDIAAWLTAPTERYDGRSAVDAIWGGDADKVVMYAQLDADRRVQ